MGGGNLIARCVRVTNARINGPGIQSKAVFTVSLLEIVRLLRVILDHQNFKSFVLQLDLLEMNVRINTLGKTDI